MNIFVGNLSFKTTEEELQREFEAFGEVDSVKIIMDHETLKSRGFAFVTMPNQEQATAAIMGMNGKEVNGFMVKANEARPREPRSGPRPERTSGGYGHNDRSGSNFSYAGPSGGGGGYDRNRSGGYSNDKDAKYL
ncbi:MAG: RNA recognition motif domain-containing protein [Syntrophobacteraceae bacterium]